MKIRATAAIMECLLEQEVDTVFGYPGGQILNVYDSLYRYSDRIRHILTLVLVYSHQFKIVSCLIFIFLFVDSDQKKQHCHPHKCENIQYCCRSLHSLMHIALYDSFPLLCVQTLLCQ